MYNKSLELTPIILFSTVTLPRNLGLLASGGGATQLYVRHILNALFLLSMNNSLTKSMKSTALYGFILLILLSCISSPQNIADQSPTEPSPPPSGRTLLFGGTLLSDQFSFRLYQYPLSIIVIATVLPNGRIQNIYIEKSSGYLNIDKTVSDTLYLWRFEEIDSSDTLKYQLIIIITGNNISKYEIYQINN
jgi:hypothetical protein